MYNQVNDELLVDFEKKKDVLKKGEKRIAAIEKLVLARLVEDIEDPALREEEETLYG